MRHLTSFKEQLREDILVMLSLAAEIKARPYPPKEGPPPAEKGGTRTR